MLSVKDWLPLLGLPNPQISLYLYLFLPLTIVVFREGSYTFIRVLYLEPPLFFTSCTKGQFSYLLPLFRIPQGIINLSIRDGAVNQGTRVVTVDPPGAPKGSSGYKLQRLPQNETRTALLGNFLISDGVPGKVGG